MAGTSSTGSPTVRRPATNVVPGEENQRLVVDGSPRTEASRKLLSQLRLVSLSSFPCATKPLLGFPNDGYLETTLLISRNLEILLTTT
jgi:hypothetical protein